LKASDAHPPPSRRILALCACSAEPAPAPAGPAIEAFELGKGQERSNLLAIQASVRPHDYADEDRLAARLYGLIEEAAKRGMVRERTIVVLPEYIGTWPVIFYESADAFEEPSTGDAMTHVVLGKPLEWTATLLSSPTEDGATYATFAVKAARMADSYHDITSSLAHEYSVTLIASPMLLPGPRVRWPRQL
jgi:hypothetical protein